ncbi:hypothetical protein TWF481_007924 [Arthrobotrys musiformis]|uniref:Uncharacterized protein n=1 Tax=Arthrobotrys musiformis TaxID=47236 RepID=A0AAV9W7S9_9PEZI
MAEGELPEEYLARVEELNRRVVQLLQQTELTRLERVRLMVARAAQQPGEARDGQQ